MCKVKSDLIEVQTNASQGDRRLAKFREKLIDMESKSICHVYGFGKWLVNDVYL